MNDKKTRQLGLSKTEYIADATLQSIHNIISRYGDAGFWGTYLKASIKIAHGSTASRDTVPVPKAVDHAIFGLRAAGAVLGVIEAVHDVWLLRQQAKDRQQKLLEFEACRRELIKVITPLFADNAKLMQDLEAGNDAWEATNRRLLALVKFRLEANNNRYNRHLYYSLQRVLFDGDATLKQNEEIARSTTLQLPAQKTLWQRVVSAAGDGVFGLVWGAGFVTGIAVLFSVSLASLYVLIPALIIGVLYAGLKIALNLYSSHKQDKRNQQFFVERAKMQSTIRLLETISQMKEGKDVDVEVGPGSDQPVESKATPKPIAEWVAKVGTRAVTMGAITTVMGAGLIYSIKTFVTSFAGALGTTLQIASSAFNGMLIGGIVFSVLHVGYKVALGIKMGIDAERKAIAKLQRHDAFQAEEATYSSDLAQLRALSVPNLLRESITRFAEHWEVNQDEKQRKAFFDLLQRVVGFELASARDATSYYQFLTHILLQGDMDQHDALDCVEQLKRVMQEPESVISDQGVRAILPLKPSVFRRFANGNIDHKGNAKRLVAAVKNHSGFIFDVMTPIMIGLAIGALFFSGPMYFAVIGAAIPVLLGLFVLNKVLEHRRTGRMKVYDRKLAVMDLRDKAVEYKHAVLPSNGVANTSEVVDETWKKQPSPLPRRRFLVESSERACADPSRESGQDHLNSVLSN